MPKTKTKRTRAKRAAEARRRAQVRSAPRPAETKPVSSYVDWDLILKSAAMFSLIGAGIIHAVWMGIHLEEWATAGIFFLALAMVETILAFALFAFPTERVYLLVVVVNLGTALVWLVSRTVGMPIGPEAGIVEPVGAPDSVATFFEVLGVAALVPLILNRPEAAASTRSPKREVRRLSPLVYPLIGGLGVYMLVLTAIAVVPAASRHEANQHSAAGGGPAGHNHQAGGSTGGGGERRGPAPARITLSADQLSFGTLRLDLAASKQVTIRFDNQDYRRHNFAIYRDQEFTKALFRGDVIKGGAETTYTFRAPPPARYPFRCDIHPFMNGTVVFR